MRPLACFLFLLGAASLPSAAPAQEPTVPRPNALYLEGLGNGGLYSWNYERLVSNRLGLRAGFASWKAVDFWGGGDARFVNVPLTLSYLPGGPGSGWELGGGLLVGHVAEESPDFGLGGDPESESRLVLDLTAILGYRWRTGGGWLYRVGFTPFYAVSGAYPDDGFFPSVGLSFGRAF